MDGGIAVAPLSAAGACLVAEDHAQAQEAAKSELKSSSGHQPPRLWATLYYEEMVEA